MHVTKLFIYPIKSLRGIELEDSQICAQGLLYDRRFILLKALEDGGYETMHISYLPQMGCFQPAIRGSTIYVSYNMPEPPLTPETPAQKTVLEVPLEPDCTNLQPTEVSMYGSGTTGYRMEDRYHAWFSECFGFPVELIYIGTNLRPVLGTLSPSAQPPVQQGWLSSISGYLRGTPDATRADGITFSDMAAFLVVTEASLRNVHDRLPGDEQMDLTKFRPNIVVDDESLEAWEEDFWAEIRIGTQTSLALTHNCLRCVSLNVDYKTGRPGTGEAGSVLKKLSKDRRVDAGDKYSPVFGRYAFLLGNEWKSDGSIRVGDEVDIVRKNDKRTAFDWKF